jgi:hypothetical protein
MGNADKGSYRLTEAKMSNKNPVKTAADAKTLYGVVVQSKDGRSNRALRVTKEVLDVIVNYTEFYGKVFSIVEVGKQWPEGTTVETIELSTSRPSCTRATYRVFSPRELTDFDKETLRAQGCFMDGQERGVFSEPKAVDNGYEYMAYSVCDSGD